MLCRFFEVLWVIWSNSTFFSPGLLIFWNIITLSGLHYIHEFCCTRCYFAIFPLPPHHLLTFATDMSSLFSYICKQHYTLKLVIMHLLVKDAITLLLLETYVTLYLWSICTKRKPQYQHSLVSPPRFEENWIRSLEKAPLMQCQTDAIITVGLRFRYW